jgi:multidrug efflux pump subunit AcrA (membrane-fusion protein)
MARLAVFAAAVAMAAGTARAHQGGVDVRGVVEVIAPDRVEVTTAKGVRAFAVTPATEFVKGGAPARREDLRPGDRVVVHGRERAGRTEAVRVEIGTPRPPAAPARR